MDEKIRVKIEEAKARQKLHFDAKQKRGLKRFIFAIGMYMVTCSFTKNNGIIVH